MANFSFANLSDDGRLPEKVAATEAELAAQVSRKAEQDADAAQTKAAIPAAIHANKNVLAQYSLPIGANEATVTFTGEKLTPEDFDALGDFVEFCKKQFVRKMQAAEAAKAPAEPAAEA